MSAPRILVVRLGAMGDVVAALPAVASLKHSIPHSKITWVIEPKWRPLLEGNPYVDSVILFDRRTFTGLRHAWRELRDGHFDLAVDFQGLIKSALVATVARPERIFGFNATYARESPASWFYSTKVPIRSYHAVDRNLDLAAAAGATNILHMFPLPPGEPEGSLPEGDFVLASPLAGWGAKQWPLEYYSSWQNFCGENADCRWWSTRLRRFEIDGRRVPRLGHSRSYSCHSKSPRRRRRRQWSAAPGCGARQPGVAIYGPTDPARHGPYGGTFTVLRSPSALTTYRRTSEPDPSMLQVEPEQVFEALAAILPASKTHRTVSG